MRSSRWAFILVGLVTCSIIYQHINQSPLANKLAEVPDDSQSPPVDQKIETPPFGKDEARLPGGDSSLADYNPDEAPVVHQAPPEVVASIGPVEFSNSNYLKQDLSYLVF